jgi:hypothetical protein
MVLRFQASDVGGGCVDQNPRNHGAKSRPGCIWATVKQNEVHSMFQLYINPGALGQVTKQILSWNQDGRWAQI